MNSTGGSLFGISGAIAFLGTSVIVPGLELIVAGPLTAILVAAGGATGNLVSALIDWGIPEETARCYEKGIRKGGILLGFYPRNSAEAEDVKNVWKGYNGELLFH